MRMCPSDWRKCATTWQSQGLSAQLQPRPAGQCSMRLASQGWSSQHGRVRLRTPMPMHAAVDLCMHLLACRLEKRRSRLQAQVQAMQAVQQRERQTMREFGALAEEHLGAAAAPLRDAQQALAQVYVLLSSLHGCRKRLQWSGGRLTWCQLRLWRLHREHAHAR
jgi:hypothetical protein